MQTSVVLLQRVLPYCRARFSTVVAASVGSVSCQGQFHWPMKSYGECAENSVVEFYGSVVAANVDSVS